ncbi:MAG: YxeA family protein [Carnobacterium sp.]|uniref:YxeA family protein n=2 Tax=Carnobacterium maltaromaticum TaxID=2751 RepID=A0AAW9JVL7_CARML|nr:YxeA family protein [Carnobacterium maltaromaticum]KRN71348.1 hypothetical protein IV76_GL000845 [Carnobacterium maltaromaticum]KRN85882.1 hypothetical protein IV75_GL001596 [Carnobacterium maltaromaticum]MBC9810097.1 YxeA family protein [Carnobacterium maltaromaticum]MCC4312468.1 hypothetical protein [Carnobacterium maltaromaticum]MDT1944002.1 YxeA family protein [Carnobacterium maltaromaticum]
MKKIISIVVLVLLVVGGSYYFKNYTGQDLYTKVNAPIEELKTKDNKGNTVLDYRYKLKAIDEKGKITMIDFTGSIGRPLREGAYLKVKYNHKKGVLSWEETSKSSIPKKALLEIESNQ